MCINLLLRYTEYMFFKLCVAKYTEWLGGIGINRSLTEQKVLKKLEIEDFRHLTKDKAIMIASMLDRMEPEVAKKVIEQFSHFSDTMKELLLDYKQTLDKVFDENSESVNSFYESCNATIMSLQKLLEKDDLKFEERKYIIDKNERHKRYRK